MPIRIPPERLADLLIDPREDLDLEIKNWLDLRGDENAKANFAKAALALANHGGGFIILGMTETDQGYVEADGRPVTLSAYNQDAINGIIQSYADPAFHCQVEIAPRHDGQVFPIVSIPGDHRSPVRAKRAGPHGNIVDNNAIYVRKSGPRSETPTNSQEWDKLLSRCLANHREEMFDQIRGLISGAVPATAQPSGIPIAISEVRRTGFNTYPFTGKMPEPGRPLDPCVLSYGNIRIANLSPNMSVNLEIALRLTTEDGWNIPLHAGPTGGLGRRLDRQGLGAEILKKHSIDPARYIENPVHLKPGEATTGSLVFLYEAFDQDDLLEFISKNIANSFRENIEISDLVSGNTIQLEPPCAYRHGQGEE